MSELSKLIVFSCALKFGLAFGVIVLKSHNNLSAFCNSGGLKEHETSAPLPGSEFRLLQDFQPITSHFRERVFLLAALCCAS